MNPVILSLQRLILYWIRCHWLAPVAVHMHSTQLVLLQNQCCMLAEGHELSRQMVCVLYLGCLLLQWDSLIAHNPTISMWVYSSNNCTNIGYVEHEWSFSAYALHVYSWWQCPGVWLSFLPAFDGSALMVDLVAGTYMCWHTYCFTMTARWYLEHDECTTVKPG